MTDAKKRICWDSGVFVRLLSKTSEPNKLAEQDICTKCLQEAIDGKTEIVISTVSIGEVVKTEELLNYYPVPIAIRDKIRSLFNEPFIVPVSADLVISQNARDLIWSHSWLKALDAIIIASAIYAKVDELFSYDGLGEKKGILDLDGLAGTPPLKIKKPHYEGQLNLID